MLGLQVMTLRYRVEVPKNQTNNQDLAAAMPPGQYVYHPACHCSRCLDKRQATSIGGQFRMILKNILNYKVTSNKRQAPEAASNKRLTSQEYKII